MKRFTTPASSRHRNESWQVIYMDMMTLIMVFFVILWTINSGKKDGISDTIGDHTTRMVSLPGDVLFAAGKIDLSASGKEVLGKLFKDESGAILNFESSGLVRRMLVIHGHTDGDGQKKDNLYLGYFRAYSAYEEILKYGKQLADHVVICTHADNSAQTGVPAFTGQLTESQRQMVEDAKARNRRITIEDRLIDDVKGEN
ncbi:MAG: hypothetical protein A4S09_14330 [Proteobacteria bacterium SG_bin7]|nr:MAG: hypothetical protein A4S09_14330 [Proteobacteria bacterium SG_bin7]